jgi:DNA repair exonuclease SbcCD ATPase subunit
LAHVTNYQLKFDINQAGDTLDILIHEDWAYRDVATLSGGQRTLLRLSWILAIATINNNKFLFLDETINHLDAETVWKVAALIESFVMKNDISLYLVTHSQEIQMMNIWKNTAEVKKD